MEGGSLLFKPRTNLRKINNFMSWLEAWTIYEFILIDNRPGLYKAMVTYRYQIQKWNEKYNWQSVYTYDIRFRAKLSSTKQLNFSDIDTHLVVTVLDATAVRRNSQRCHRCSSSDHMIAQCPFPSRPSVDSDTSARPKAVYHSGSEVCHKYQSGECKYRFCKRAHVL